MFEKGHKPYPVKSGMPGRSPVQVKAARDVATAVREDVPATIMVRFHLAILENHNPHLVRDEEGELEVTWDDRGGIPPTLDQKTKALQWLADRGYGTPVQTVLLDAHLRAQVSDSSGALAPGASTPAMMIAMRRLLLGQGAELAPELPVLDVGDLPAGIIPGGEESED